MAERGAAPLEDAPFFGLCLILEELERIKFQAKKGKRLKEEACKEEKQKTVLRFYYGQFPLGNPYILMRLLDVERDPRRYGMQAPSLVKSFMRNMHISEKGPAGRQLLGWKTSSNKDLSLSIAFFFKGDDVSSGKTLGQVNELLDELDDAGWPYPDTLRQDNAISQLYNRLSELEAKWLTRVILRDLDIGVDEYILLSTFDYALHAIFKKQGTLSTACETTGKFLEELDPLIKRSERMVRARKWTQEKKDEHDKECRRELLKKYNVCVIGGFIKPAQSTAGTSWKDIKKLVAEKYHPRLDLLVETKWDGERIHIHIWRNEMNGEAYVRIFSRHGNDSTKARQNCLPDVRAALRLDAEYKPLDGSEVSSVVLDGEILTFNSREKAVEPFGFVQQIARDQRSGKDLDFDQHFLIKFFDILHLNGEWVMDKPLHERKVLLERIVQPIPTRVEVEHGERIDVGTEDGQRRLEARFIEAFELGLEGLMIKNPYFQYAVVSTALEAGILTTRTLMVRLDSRDGWLKLKRDRIPGLGDTIDLLIFGGDLRVNETRRGGKADMMAGVDCVFRTFHVGCVSTSNLQEALKRNEADTLCIVPLFDVSAGFSTEELKLLTDRLQDYATPYTPSDCDLPYAIDNRFQRRLCHVFTCKPFVTTLLGSGFVYGVTGFGPAQRIRKDYAILRHPRVERVKGDSPIWSALCLDEYRAIVESVMSRPAAENVDHFRTVLQSALNAGTCPRISKVTVMFEPVEFGQVHEGRDSISTANDGRGYTLASNPRNECDAPMEIDQQIRMQPEGIAAGADLNHPSGSSNVVHISPTGISSAPIASTPIAGPEQHPIASKCGSPLLESASDVENMQVDSNSQTLMSPKSWSTGQKHATGAELPRTAKRARRTASMPAHLSARPLGSGMIRGVEVTAPIAVHLDSALSEDVREALESGQIVYLVDVREFGRGWRMTQVDILGEWAVVASHQLLYDIHNAVREQTCDSEALAEIWISHYLVGYDQLRQQPFGEWFLGRTCSCSSWQPAPLPPANESYPAVTGTLLDGPRSNDDILAMIGKGGKLRRYATK